MKIATILAVTALLTLPLTVMAQDPINGSSPPRELTPELRAASIALGTHLEAAQRLRKEGKFEEALAEAAQAVPYIFKMGWDTYVPLAQEIADIYLAMGRPDVALKAYRDGYQWIGDQFSSHRYSTKPGDPLTFISEYALALAKYGRPEQAQMIYYSEMLGRQNNPWTWTPPLLLTFEADSTGDYWEYSEIRLHAAMLILDSLSSRTIGPNLPKRASELFPEWYYPYMVQAVMDSDTMTLAEREQLLDTAYTKARTDQERQWVEDVRSVIRLDPKQWNTELRKFGKLWPNALNSVQTYQTKWAELRANWQDYGVERAQMFASGG